MGDDVELCRKWDDGWVTAAGDVNLHISTKAFRIIFFFGGAAPLVWPLVCSAEPFVAGDTILDCAPFGMSDIPLFFLNCTPLFRSRRSGVEASLQVTVSQDCRLPANHSCTHGQQIRSIGSQISPRNGLLATKNPNGGM